MIIWKVLFSIFTFIFSPIYWTQNIHKLWHFSRCISIITSNSIINSSGKFDTTSSIPWVVMCCGVVTWTVPNSGLSIRHKSLDISGIFKTSKVIREICCPCNWIELGNLTWKGGILFCNCAYLSSVSLVHSLYIFTASVFTQSKYTLLSWLESSHISVKTSFIICILRNQSIIYNNIYYK